MTPDLLRRAAAAYDPERGQSALAYKLDVTPRTMRRRLAAEWDIPQDYPQRIAKLLRERAAELHAQATQCEMVANEIEKG